MSWCGCDGLCHPTARVEAAMVLQTKIVCNGGVVVPAASQLATRRCLLPLSLMLKSLLARVLAVPVANLSGEGAKSFEIGDLKGAWRLWLASGPTSNSPILDCVNVR